MGAVPEAARSVKSRIPAISKPDYAPVQEFTHKVYANGRNTLRTATGMVKATWQRSRVHVPRPASEHMPDPNGTLRDGFRQIHQSYLEPPRPNEKIHPALRGLHSSTETLVGADMGRLKEVTVSNTPPKVDTGRIPEAKVATLDSVSRGSSTNNSTPAVSRSPTIEIPTIELPTSPGSPPISLARVYRVDIAFRPVSPEHIELKEGQTAILHLVYDDGWVSQPSDRKWHIY